MKVVKKLNDGRYAYIDFFPEREKVREAHDRLKRKLLRSPKPEEMAYVLKESPAKARDLLYLHVLGYSEPTEEDIRLSREKLWRTINMGLDLPNNNELIEDGIEFIEVNGMDSRILYLNYHRSEDGFSRADYIRSKKYMEELERWPQI